MKYVPREPRSRKLEQYTPTDAGGNRDDPETDDGSDARKNGATHVSAIIESLDLRSMAVRRIATPPRPSVRGKFFFAGEQKLYLKGVTYGTFRRNSKFERYPEPAAVAHDFAQMAASGVNTVRTYEVPPRWLLDLAHQHGLWVIVGILWEQYECLPDDSARLRRIERKVRAAVRVCGGHPAVLAYSIGNEIPASIVRWHGARRVEQLLRRLYEAVKREDRDALVTYVNYPTTEYLDLSFLDFVAFNVYLDTPAELESYLARLHNLARDRPLLIAELGVDSYGQGERAQAEALAAQIRTAAAGGCAGIVVFAWTDEWHHAGCDIEDWQFGLVRGDRQPKPALAAVQRAFTEVPFAGDMKWPHITVVVCSYNGARTMRDCMLGLARLEYPNFDVIVVDDGSTDDTAALAGEFGVCVIRTANRGLSSARNTGIRAARGEIIAFLDDDAWPDPHWLHYLAYTFISGSHAAVGGPNIVPVGSGPIADCVAHAPGGPMHVLISDHEAEHVPGCNLAARRNRLIEVGGFDPQFRVAGDDVDLCWKLQSRGWTLGFSHAAMVWHHRRNSVRTYWKQQLGYGKAEALLAEKWPEKYNLAGHARWSGRLYGAGLLRTLGAPRRIYHGSWGSALFQSVYETAPEGVRALLLMPEWYLALAVLAVLGGLTLFFPLMLLVLPVFALGVGATVVQAALSARGALRGSTLPGAPGAHRRWALCTMLHLLQPAARLWGRMQHGLTPWRRAGEAALVPPAARVFSMWTELRRAPHEVLRDIETRWRDQTRSVQRGGSFDRWDLEGWGGVLGAARVLMVVEEHGGGKQLFRFRVWPRVPTAAFAASALLGGLAASALLGGAPVVASILGGLAVLLGLETLLNCATATETLVHVLTSYASTSSAYVVQHRTSHDRQVRLASLQEAGRRRRRRDMALER